MVCAGSELGDQRYRRDAAQTYGVREIYGIPYGYAGLANPQQHPPLMLDPDGVDMIHMKGGVDHLGRRAAAKMSK